MTRMASAHEVDSDITWPRFPGLLQEIFQWRPKPKGKKQKSQIDDTRTEISYNASTAAGDADFETSTYVSKDFGTPSSRSVESKRSKKRGKHGSKKSLKDASGSVYSEAASSSPDTPEPSKEAQNEVSYLVTLNCPLCDDPDCILNKASQCPLIRHNAEETANNDSCTFCRSNCQCKENKAKYLPVSGLVPRDENGIAVTLLKANGGPIENSYEWANRRQWAVPNSVKWEHKLSEWITAPAQDTTKPEEGSHRKRSHKSKNKRKSRATASATNVTPEITSNGEEPRIEEDNLETNLILDGHGFKIFAKGEEKILINYDRKNCKYMGCSCVPNLEATDCGCKEGHLGRNKNNIKHNKNCRNKPKKMSLVKETSHGIEPIQEAKYVKEKNKSCESMVSKSASADNIDESNHKLKKVDSKKGDQQKQNNDEKRVNLIGKDVRNESRADHLERSLREILGDEYRNGCEAKNADEPENTPKTDLFVNVSCPAFDQPGAAFYRGNTCTCAQNCCYGTYQ